ncbi:MAG: aminomethyltransferase family protein, partial [Pseudomonadota bacterium]
IATNITSGMGMLGLMGPKSRAVLESICKQDFSNDGFAFGQSRMIELGFAHVRASRITYVGELGWELYVGTEFMPHLFDLLCEAGEDFGLKHAGYHAMNACRTEKGYRHWGHDITDEDTPLQAGLGFAVAFDKSGGFIGRDRLLQDRELGLPTRRMIQLALECDDETTPLMYHEEPIWVNGVRCGAITSGTWAYRLGKSIGMGYITHGDPISKDFIESSEFHIEIANKKYKATASLRPLYDPKSSRIRS